jgi:hypothetical protein
MGYLTKASKTYTGEKIVSSINGVVKPGCPHVEA